MIAVQAASAPKPPSIFPFPINTREIDHGNSGEEKDGQKGAEENGQESN
jgi:hypothetical protein